MTFEEVISQMIDQGFEAYEAGNHNRALALLLPIKDVDHRVDFFLAMIYCFSEVKDYQKARKHLVSYMHRSADSLYRVDEGTLEYFLRLICLSEDDYDSFEVFALFKIAQGDESHYLTLAYQYLNEAQHYHLVLVFAQLGQEYLDNLPEEDRLAVLGRAGYHVAACVYVWHGLYEKAQPLEAFFLDNEYYEDHNLNGGFLLLVLGMGDTDYLNGLFGRFDLKDRYPYHYYYFYYCIQNLNEIMPKAMNFDMIRLSRNVEYARKRYEEGRYYHLYTTDLLPNLDELLTQIDSIAANDWRRLLALDSLLQMATNGGELVVHLATQAVRDTLESTPAMLLNFDWKNSNELYGTVGNPNVNYRRFALIELCMLLTMIYRFDRDLPERMNIPELVASGDIRQILTAIERKL